jgi:two-component system LytT family response regulator
MEKIKCIAVDDEPYAVKQIADYILKTPFLELVGTCNNAFEAMELIASEKIDLLFLDVNMPEMSGLDFAKTISPEIKIVFTTAYSQFAVESYKVDALHYLLKPITYDDFLNAANKAQKHFQQSTIRQTEKQNKNHFFVSSEGKMEKINLHEIDYIESMSEYVKIFLSNKKHIVTLMRLKNLESFLPQDWFIRVHRSYIVNTKNITTIERNRIVFYGNVYIPISDQYKNDFKTFIDNYFI